MLSKKIETALNKQVNDEFYASYLYLSMSAYCQTMNLDGFSDYLKQQSDEERDHAMRLYNFVLDRGGKVALDTIKKPPSAFKSIRDVFEQVYAHEKAVTAKISKLYDLALKANDYSTQVELQWFVSEQVEEEKTAQSILEQIKRAGSDGPALLILDKYIITGFNPHTAEA